MSNIHFEGTFSRQLEAKGRKLTHLKIGERIIVTEIPFLPTKKYNGYVKPDCLLNKMGEIVDVAVKKFIHGVDVAYGIRFFGELSQFIDARIRLENNYILYLPAYTVMSQTEWELRGYSKDTEDTILLIPVG